MKSADPTRPPARHLKIGIAVLMFAGAYMAAIMLFGVLAFLLMLPTLLALVLGGPMVLIGFVAKENRKAKRVWQHLAAFAAIIAVLYFLVADAGSIRLLDYRNRLIVALTGGQGALQSWAVQVLQEPRSLMPSDGVEGWRVPQEHWSKQVFLLNPSRVFIRPVFQNNQEGLCLFFGGGFFHWSIIIGPPGAVPNAEDYRYVDLWFHWRDGIYDCHW